MLRKIKIHHWNNRDPSNPNQKTYRNIRPEQYKTHNNIDKSYREHNYLLWCDNRRNDDEFFVLLKIMLKKQALNVILIKIIINNDLLKGYDSQVCRSECIQDARHPSSSCGTSRGGRRHGQAVCSTPLAFCCPCRHWQHGKWCTKNKKYI